MPAGFYTDPEYALQTLRSGELSCSIAARIPDQYWIDRHIIAMVSLGSYGEDTPAWISKIYGNDKHKAALLKMMLNLSVDEPIRLDDNELELVKGSNLKSIKWGSDGTAYYIEGTRDWELPVKFEQQYRKQRDQYDEMYVRIMEWAESLGDDQ